MRFADIPFHDDVKARLRALVDSGHMPHALLLEGPVGSGKFAMARALAQYIHCTDRTPDGDACGRCPACLQHEKFNHIDTYYSYPVLKRKGSASVTVSDDYATEFRRLLVESPFMDFELWLSLLGNPNGQPAIYVDEATMMLERLSRTARQSQYKIVVMWLPERLNEAAANKLLKLVEEPYPDTLFIMTSDNPAEILPTIYSRTQRVAVRRYADDEVAAILERAGIDRGEAEMAASISDGDVTAAMRAVNGTDRERSLYLDMFKELMRMAYTRKVAELRRWSASVADMGREGAMRFYSYCARMVRENFVYNIGEERLVAMSAAEREFSTRFAPFINVYNVEDIFNILTDARNDTLLNGNQKIIAFDLAVKMILLIKRGQEAG